MTPAEEAVAIDLLLAPYENDPRGNVTAYLIESAIKRADREASREMATAGRYTGECRPPEPRKHQKPAERPQPLPLKNRKRLLARKRR